MVKVGFSVRWQERKATDTTGDAVRWQRRSVFAGNDGGALHKRVALAPSTTHTAFSQYRKQGRCIAVERQPTHSTGEV